MFYFPLGSLQIDKSRRREKLMFKGCTTANICTQKPQSEAKRMQDVTQSRHDCLRVWCLCRIDDGWTGSFRLQCPETCSIIVLSWLAKDEKLNLSILFFKCWAFFSLNIVIYDISYMMYTFLNSHAGLKVYIDILIMTCVPNPTIRLKGYSNNQLLICIWGCVFFIGIKPSAS